MAYRRTFPMAFALLSAATLAGNWNGLLKKHLLTE
jgi:hypothetical protein